MRAPLQIAPAGDARRVGGYTRLDSSLNLEPAPLHAKRSGAGSFFGVVAMVVVAGMAQAAAPPKGTEDYEIMADYAEWIAQLHVGGVSCCSTSDGRPVQARLHGEHWQVRFRPGQLPGAPTEWTDVRDAAVYRGVNPVGVPIAWWFGGEVRCFAPPNGI